ncbi:MAG TPA: NAD(P)H-dependent oxidoreductase [Geminicoccus sp.]|jgi:putative NADPH-quinone reductase|uniref:NAD(P)H-dependent oxidoreductase n=1 Tax=Geminicoccus sp. TaxID=2024832 RepID=UPI002E30B092|nr:NAD(P)H-dependent oxidoreductase [Geminicoccus sp.]HEX2527135.1 NAD(P)H-dependent oxidoreductase [Geminicoccus sp.]
MRIFWLYAHPCPESFHGSIRARAVAAAERAGHVVDMCDLVAEGFDPVMRAEERRRYHDLSRNQQGLEGWIERINLAEWLVCQFPVWCFGPPALLKGFFDRIFLPGVAFDLSKPADVTSKFNRLNRVTGIASYGQDRLKAFWMGDPPRKLITRYLAWYAGRGARVRYLPVYRMNTIDQDQRERFIRQVERHFER